MVIQIYYDTTQVQSLGIVNTGTCQTLFDDQMCALLDIPKRQVRGGECGMFPNAGQTEMHPYKGIIIGFLIDILSEGNSLIVDNIRVV